MPDGIVCRGDENGDLMPEQYNFVKTARKGDRIAVIGTGISGMSAAWLLATEHNVTVYEADRRPGGHSNSVLTPAGDMIDTGFIVFNDWTYPNLVALFNHLDIDNVESRMSFAVSVRRGALEYSGDGLKGLFAQKTNLLRPRFHRMWRDILRFYRDAPADLAEGRLNQIRLGDYLTSHQYSKGFIEDHLLPMGAAIWSGSVSGMKEFPAESFIRFFRNHGLLLLKDRPQWRTVKGGSWAYVQKLVRATPAKFNLGQAVTSVRQVGQQIEVSASGVEPELYDHVVMACHSDQALTLLADPTALEKSILGDLRYQTNIVYLHQDRDLMPLRRDVWASWNYLGEREVRQGGLASVTYWMNNLQAIPHERPYFVSLNPLAPPRTETVLAQFDYQHPVFDAAAINAQTRLGQLQGQRGLWFCGAYAGYGFHEDGLSAGLMVAEQLGGVQRPWQVTEASPAGQHVAALCDPAQAVAA